MSKSNSLRDLEETAKEKLKQWYRHRTDENRERLVRATRDWLRAEREKAA